MTLHPDIAKVLATLPEGPAGPLDPVAMRAGEEAQVPPVDQRTAVGAVDDTTVQTRAGRVPIRIYTPDEKDTYGLLIYFHGGAFFLGSLETHDALARNLAKETGYKVISVDFRRAPENDFPAGLDDSYGVVRWAADNGATLKWDQTNLALAGDSSGANFVAAISAMAHDDGFDAITHQILYYPSVDLDFDEERYASLKDNATGYGLETPGLEPFNAFYLNSGADRDDPRVSPIKREDLSGLPPALIITAEYDPLRDEGEAYGQRLRQAGVATTVSRYAGANHGFLVNFAWIPQYYRAFQETADFLSGA